MKTDKVIPEENKDSNTETLDVTEENSNVDSGFDVLFTQSDVRLMNTDGTLNVRHKGIERLKKINVYKEFVKLGSVKFYSALLILYVLINLFFTFLYYEIGLNSLVTPDLDVSWLDAFFFSMQTFTTVGYGHIHPESIGANVLASFEAFLGLLYFAVSTGLVYGRFSNSKAEIDFSKNILLFEQNGNKNLMLRLANVSSTELSDLKAEIIMSWIEIENGQPFRRYRKLKLQMDQINLLTTSWTIIHEIDENSPCSILERKEAYTGLEFMVFITAFDDIYDQKVKVRRSYLESEIVHNAKFIPITSYDKVTAIVDLDRLSKYESTI